MKLSRFVMAVLAGFTAVTAASAGGIRVQVFDASDKSPVIDSFVFIGYDFSASGEPELAEPASLRMR